MATLGLGYWGILPWDVYFRFLRQKIQGDQRKDDRTGNKEGLALKTLSRLVLSHDKSGSRRALRLCVEYYAYALWGICDICSVGWYVG